MVDRTPRASPEMPDTSAARLVLAAIGTSATAALAERTAGATAQRRYRPSDEEAVLEAEVRVAHLFNAAATAVVAYLNAGTPSAATVDMLRAVAQLTSALAGPQPLARNTCLEASL